MNKWLYIKNSILYFFYKNKLKSKTRADGFCNLCGKEVIGQTNLFYCGEKCRIRGWNMRNPGKDWVEEFHKDFFGRS